MSYNDSGGPVLHNCLIKNRWITIISSKIDLILMIVSELLYSLIIRFANQWILQLVCN